jgi:hypothetical protein
VQPTWSPARPGCEGRERGHYAAPMRYERLLLPAAAVAGVVLLGLAVFYWVEPADSLPSFFPGHQAGSDHVHFKHGLACLLLGLACFVFVWFRSGPTRRPSPG